MAALTADRKTKTAVPGLRDFPVAAGVVIYAGAIVSVDSSGNARPGRTNTTDKCVGINYGDTVDNTAGIAGALRVTVRNDRVGFFGNSTSGDLIATANVGADCFVVDDQTVALTNGTSTRVRAGKIHSVTTDGVGVVFDQ
jgi:hypothetical protein